MCSFAMTSNSKPKTKLQNQPRSQTKPKALIFARPYSAQPGLAQRSWARRGPSRPGPTRHGSAGLGPARPSPARLGLAWLSAARQIVLARPGSAIPGSARPGSSGLGPARPGSARPGPVLPILGSARFSPARPGPALPGPARLCRARPGLAQSGSAQPLCLARIGPVRLDPAGQACPCSVRPAPARLGWGRPIPARFDPALLGPARQCKFKQKLRVGARFIKLFSRSTNVETGFSVGC